MASTTESPFSFTTKINGDLLTVRGDTLDEFRSRMVELAADEQFMDALGDLQALAGHAPAVAAVQAAMPGSTVVSTTTVSQPAGRPTEETDKYGAVWTYDHPDAPALPDGRGLYAMKVWNDRSGKARKAWVDPSKGPKPFAPGSSEAPIQWI
jgi:hypothetical protein